MHFDRDWDSHYDHFYHWPWDSGFYHLRCPTRHRYWGLGATDFDVCARDWHEHHDDASPWCHRSCLASKVTIETGDEVDSNGKGTFKVIIDVHHFRPDELAVKVKNNDTVLLEGKQKEDRAGGKEGRVFCITKEFSRKYKLPRNYDATQAKATLSTDGILTIVVPAPPPLDDVERVVDIIPTGAYFGSTDVEQKNGPAIDDGVGESSATQ